MNATSGKSLLRFSLHKLCIAALGAGLLLVGAWLSAALRIEMRDLSITATSFTNLITASHHALGPLAYALWSLTLWICWLVACFLFVPNHNREQRIHHLSFIARNGPVLGLLGTVWALANAGVVEGGLLQNGGASPQHALDLVGQSLWTTLVGAGLGLVAEVVRHIDESHCPQKTDDEDE